MDQFSDTNIHPIKAEASKMCYYAADEYRCLMTKFLELDNVRIIPKEIVFSDAFEGKTFEQLVTVVNCGVKSASIRICNPNSNAFRIEAVKVCWLPPGLCIKRKIKYTHLNAMAIFHGYLPVYINEHLINMQISVTMSHRAMALVKPKLDFGVMDVGNSVKVCTVELKNIGSKVTKFAIDCFENDLECNLEPMKGYVEPLQSALINVELMGFTEGPFFRELWIKTDPPQNMQITATFIAPKLSIVYPDFTRDFTIIDFEKLYYGTQSYKCLVIKNNSSLPIVFYTKVEYNKKLMSFSEAKEKSDLQFFEVFPHEGRLQPFQYFVIRLGFTAERKMVKKRYYVSLLNIIKINRRDMQTSSTTEDCAPSKCMDIHQRLSLSEQVSLEDTSHASEWSLTSKILEAKPFVDDFIRVALHGIMVEPEIDLKPNSLTLNDLEMNKCYYRVLSIKNLCPHLPISFKNKKCFTIDVSPFEGTLGVGESTELSVTIKPVKMGKVNTEIQLDLIFEKDNLRTVVDVVSVPVSYFVKFGTSIREPEFVMGITPKITNEVGFLVDDIRFNTKCKLPRAAIVDKNYGAFNRKNDDLIAFPNDMPTSLKPWKNKTSCKTIFANLPRKVVSYDSYCFDSAESEIKRILEEYYNSLIRPKTLKKTKKSIKLKDYEVTNQKLLKLQEQCVICPEKNVVDFVLPDFIPLNPEKLSKIFVYPQYINMGKVLPGVPWERSFFVYNSNDFKIKVKAYSLKSSITCKNDHVLIKARHIQKLTLQFLTDRMGKYCIPVNILVNENHIVHIKVFAVVTTKTITCNLNEVNVSQNELSFVDLSNKSNLDTPFDWNTSDTMNTIKICPMSGVVPARKTISCVVSYVLPNQCNAYELFLNIAKGDHPTSLKVAINRKPTVVAFNTEKIVLHQIPLNHLVEEQLILRNFSEEAANFSILNPEPILGVIIKPSNGILHAKADQVFIINICIKSVITFNCTLEFRVRDKKVTIPLKGSTIYPNLIIKPELFQLKNIIPYTIEKHLFEVENQCPVKSWINFRANDIPHLTITDHYKNVVKENVALEPHDTKSFFLEFIPQEEEIYCVFLPFQINDILGPSIISLEKSTSPKYFTNDIQYCVGGSSKLPKSLPFLKINFSSVKPIITFSSLNIHFDFNNSEASKEFVVSNVSTEEQKFCVDIPKSVKIFNLNYEDGGECVLFKNCYMCRLNPDEEAKFTIQFNTLKYGIFEDQLSIYLKFDSQRMSLNPVKLKGSYHAPSIVPEKDTIFFSSVMINSTVQKTLTLKFLHHEENCCVEVNSSINYLTVVMEKVGPDQVVSFSYNPKVEHYIDDQVSFNCTCKALCLLSVKGVADNCILTTYLNRKRRMFVLDVSMYENIENQIIGTLENWMYTQGFFCKQFFTIPDGIAAYPVDIKISNKSTFSSKKHALLLPLRKLLLQLGGQKITKSITTGLPSCFEDVQGTLYVYTTYRNILLYLKSLNLLAPHIRPELLLPYKEYLVFRKDIVDKNNDVSMLNIFDENEFKKITKKCWIDLILQVYKIFVFNRIQPPVIPCSFFTYYETNKFKLFQHNENEIVLLLWAEFHFENQKNNLCNFEKCAKSRMVRSFSKDFKDSLVLAAITATYCPYFLNFHDMFNCPTNYEQLFHNACRVIQVWQKINLSYQIHPDQIIQSNPIEMLMLLTYLYTILPHYLPNDTIIIDAPLSEVGAYNITLTNTSAATVAYKCIFFNNDLHHFTMEQDMVCVQSNKNRNVQVIYHAKKVLTSKATLLLSGECMGMNYGKTIAFNLIGNPDIANAVVEIPVTVPIYKPASLEIVVNSPYKQSYIADLYFLVKSPPESMNDFASWSVLKNRFVPRQFKILVKKDEYRFNSSGQLKFKCAACWATISKQYHLLYFISESVGDFCIKLKVHVAISKKHFEIIYALLPNEFNTACICHNNEINIKCPKIVIINVPCKNALLSKCFQKMINYCNEESNNPDFWSKYLDKSTGFQVLQSFIDNAVYISLFELEKLFVDSLSYLILLNESDPFTTFTNFIKINDITSSQSVQLPIHWNSEKIPDIEYIKLLAEHKQEIRVYKILFCNKKFSN